LDDAIVGESGVGCGACDVETIPEGDQLGAEAFETLLEVDGFV
jgi:hypothetical protein